MLRASLLLSGAAALVLAGPACTRDEPAGPPGAATRRVLFIGNSLTESNGLAAMVAAMGDSVGTPIVAYDASMSGVSLEDHWTMGSARAVLASQGWDVVVLQQGPSGLPESRENLREWAARWAVEIRNAGAEPVLYMPWPDATRMSAFDSVSMSYRQAASAIGAAVIPGGEAWQAAWRRDPTLALYGSDGFHPSPLGTWVVAVATWSRLTGRPPAGAPRAIAWRNTSLVVPQAQAATIRAAVAEVLP